MRSSLGKAFRAHQDSLQQHLGGWDALTVPQRELIDQAARMRLLEGLAWAEVLRTGVIKDNALSPAVSAFLKAAGDRRAVLQLLGLERRTKDAQTLAQYLAERKATRG
jgi:hypothetical protein